MTATMIPHWMTKSKPAGAARLGRASRLLLSLLLFSLTASACDALPGSQAGSQGVVYLPPTPAVTPTAAAVTPTLQANPAIRPSPSPPCENNLVFLADVTIPDGSITNPGEPLDKRWSVQNSGSCNWDEQYSLRLIAGSSLSAPEILFLYPARSGTTVEIQINLRAPDEAGVYRSAWQAYDPLEQAFGDPIFVDFVVEPTGEDSGE